jgi:hypothetical protein
MHLHATLRDAPDAVLALAEALRAKRAPER